VIHSSLQPPTFYSALYVGHRSARSHDERCHPCNLLAAYGTLRRRSIFHKLPVAAARLQFFSRGLVGGRLFWQRTYPALIQDRGTVQVELFRIVDPSVLDDVDRYEGFDPNNLRASLFVRNQTLLLNPRVRAWIYFLNRQMLRGDSDYGAGRAIGGASHSGLGA
jgi:gamma-glutamylcyclotransferase (GGCT)/AIG2-like uncharacterized protein YtfP